MGGRESGPPKSTTRRLGLASEGVCPGKETTNEIDTFNARRAGRPGYRCCSRAERRARGLQGYEAHLSRRDYVSPDRAGWTPAARTAFVSRVLRREVPGRAVAQW